jgi:hypothetical protein
MVQNLTIELFDFIKILAQIINIFNFLAFKKKLYAKMVKVI